MAGYDTFEWKLSDIGRQMGEKMDKLMKEFEAKVKAAESELKK
ncbi:MAG: hypothetical protein AAB734_01545 [Patescibacteria group bacterium]